MSGNDGHHDLKPVFAGRPSWIAPLRPCTFVGLPVGLDSSYFPRFHLFPQVGGIRCPRRNPRRHALTAAFAAIDKPRAYDVRFDDKVVIKRKIRVGYLRWE